MIRSAKLLGAVALLFIGAGCYARSVPIPPADLGSAAAERRTPGGGSEQRLGVRLAESPNNVPHIQASRVVENLATRLAESGMFAEVVYPLTPLAAPAPDVVYDVRVASQADLHTLTNLLKDAVVGVSILLLQPVLPTAYDLDVTITAVESTGSERQVATHQAASRRRFETTWLAPPAESITRWHDETADSAVAALLAEIQGARGTLPSSRVGP